MGNNVSQQQERHSSAALVPEERVERLSKDVRTVRRLLQEVFTRHVQLQTKVERLEEQSQDTISTSRASGPSWIKADIHLGNGAVWGQGAQEDVAAVMHHSGCLADAQLQITLTTAEQQKGSVQASAVIAATPEAAWLQQVAFRRAVGKSWQAYVAPLRGRGDEAAVTLNAQADSGLCRQVRQGCPLHQWCQGPAAAATWAGLQGSCTLAHFLTGGRDPMSLVQVTTNAGSRLSLGLTALKAWDSSSSNSPPAASDSQQGADNAGAAPVQQQGASASEAQAAGQHPWHSWGLMSGLALPQPAVQEGAAQYMLAVSGAYNWNWQMAASGWLDLSGGPQKLPSFGLTVSPYPDSSSSRWQLALAREKDPQQWTGEISVQQPCGAGAYLTTGLVLTQSEHPQQCRSAALVVRSDWSI